MTNMQILYSNQNPKLCPSKNSIFLAGPTPRLKETPSWRPDAVKLFEKYNFDGTLCYPEYPEYIDGIDYTNQIEWEHYCLDKCSIIMFWVPRDIKGNMPAFTTNIEFGYWMATDKSKVVYGRTDQADNMRYMDYLYNKLWEGKLKPANNLNKLVLNCFALAQIL